MFLRRAGIAVTIVAIICTLLAVPRERVRVPEYEVYVRDSNGRPLANITVTQFLQDYSSGTDVERSVEVVTNEEGHAFLSRVGRTESLMGEILGCARQVVATGPHASCGYYSDITASANSFVEVARSEKNSPHQAHQRSLQITLKSCPSGSPGSVPSPNEQSEFPAKRRYLQLRPGWRAHSGKTADNADFRGSAAGESLIL